MASMRRIIMLAAVAAVAVTPRVSQAQLNGQVLNAQHSFPTLGQNLIDLGNATVGPGVEWPSYFNLLTIDASNSNILIDFLTSSTWISGTFNGFRFSDVNNTIPAFTNVSVNGATNLGGFSQSNLSWDADNIYVDMQGLSFNANSVVSVDVTSTPEPASMALLGTGLVGVFAVARRRRTA